MEKKEIRYYKEFTDDFAVSENQDIKLPLDYQYIRRDFLSRIKSKLIYGSAVIFGYIYCKLHLHIRFKNLKAMKSIKDKGFFIYGNHTQPIGDVVIPAFCAFPKRIYTVVSPANFGIPVIGKTLPFLGALPLADTPKGMKSFTEAMNTRIEEKKIVTIYPEAHVWEYYNEIRPFSEASFRYPVKLGVPVFAMTTTYQKRKLFKKPKTTVYVDGPFYPDGELHPKEQSKALHKQVYEAMVERAKLSDYAYIEYKKEETPE